MAERAFLILHGLANHRPPSHWHAWLAGRLRARGERVAYPQLPEPDEPSLVAWRSALERELRALDGHAVVVVGHSLGCTLWMLCADRARCERLVLVAPPDPPSVPVDGGFAYEACALDLAAVRASVAGELLLVRSDGADPYDPDGAAAARVERIADRVEVVPGGGHLSEDDGFGPWPEIEGWVLGAR